MDGFSRFQREGWHTPVDPECPEVDEYTTTLLEDPMSDGAPVDEILAAFERRHMASCERCAEFGAANIEVV